MDGEAGEPHFVRHGLSEEDVRDVLAGPLASPEGEASLEDPSETLMEVPVNLVPAVRRLIAEHRRGAQQPVAADAASRRG